MISRSHTSQSHFGRISGESKIAPFLLMLVFSKLLLICSTFISYDLLQSSPVLQVLSTKLICCCIPYILIYQPSSAMRPLSKQLWIKIILNSGWYALIMVLWCVGLKAVGPIRTILIFDHHETIVLACISYLVAGNDKYKSRGAVLFVSGLFILLLLDNDSTLNNHIEAENESFITHLLYAVFDQLGVPDHKQGVLVLILALIFSTLQRSYQKKLAVETGGNKKLHTLTITLSGALLSLFSLIQMAFGGESTSFSTWLSSVLPWCILIAIAIVANYLVENIAISRLDTSPVVKYSSIISAVIVIVLGSLWHGPLINATSKDENEAHHHISGGVIVSVVLLVLSTIRLSKPSGPSHGTFIGYGDTGLPMYAFDKKVVKSKILPFVKTTLSQIMASSDSRHIFYFLCINLIFCGIELVYGLWTNSLGLISDGFHMLFDCAALLVGLLAAIMQKWPKTRVYSYGFARVDILSGYVNALLLCVVAFFVFTEALERLVDPPEVSTDRLFIVSVAGLIVNLIGIFAFSHAHSHGGAPCTGHGDKGHGHSHSDGHGHSHSDGHGHSHSGGHGHSHSNNHGHSHNGGHGHSHGGGGGNGGGGPQNRNLQGVFLHIMADTLGSVGVILSSLFIEYFGWLRSDPLCSIVIAVLIFLSVIPLLKDSILVLLQRIPKEKQAGFYEALNEIQHLENVVNIYDPHLWQYSSDTFITSFRVYVNARANEQAITARATDILKNYGFNETSIQVEKELFKKALVSYGPSLLDNTENYNIGIYNTVTGDSSIKLSYD